MPNIAAFRGLRYNLGHVGSLSDVVAPPYDVIGPDLQKSLYQRHPANIIRLILNRAEPGDDSSISRYGRAARFFKNWQQECVLQLDPDPAVYVYHQQFDYAGHSFTRRGFMARLWLERFGTGAVYPHEETHAAAKVDRLRLTNACKANLSQIFGIYPDPTNDAQNLLEDAICGCTPVEATDHLDVVHRLWPVTDVETIAELTLLMGPRPLFVADGHHRYETACDYRDQLAGNGTLDPTHPANFVMTMCVSMNDPGMIVLPTHRLFEGLPFLAASELADRLGGCFDLTPAGEGAAAAGSIWQTIEDDAEQDQIGLYTAKDRMWTLARLNETGRERMSQVAADQSEDWRRLGVSILHRLAIETLLDNRNLPKPNYVHLIDEVVQGLESTDCPLAALVMPATLDHIRAIAEHGERMPAKSTYFYPKLLSGLVINPLE